MIEVFFMGLFFGGLMVYLVIMMACSKPDPNWRETMLLQLTCYDCDEVVAPVEFAMHGGLCEDCYEKRHGYNYRSSKPKANKNE